MCDFQCIPKILDYCDSRTLAFRRMLENRGKDLSFINLVSMRVSTQLAIEAVGAQAGEHFLVADSAEEFAKSVLKLLANQEYADRMTESARQFVEKNFDWDSIGDQLNKIVHDLVPEQKRSGTRLWAAD